jgi:2-hydroxychromene-2-carboxylate isomerase
MHALEFLFDPISPFACLAFHRLPHELAGCTYSVTYRPVLFGALLSHHGHKGPAEIEPKRAWTYRHVAWLAHQHGLQLDMPASHPFNPLPLLRLAVAAGPSRRVVQALFDHVWVGGHEAGDPARLAALREQLAPARDPDGPEVKAELRAQTERAIAEGAFGVPTVMMGGRAFWGLDALPMLRAALQGDPWFEGPAWEAASQPRPGLVRR